MAVVTFLRAHLDAALAIALTLGFAAEVALRGSLAAAEPYILTVPADETLAAVATVAFLLSLAWRRRFPLLPLALAYVPLLLTGGVPLDASLVLLSGLVIACYSVGAWSDGRPGLVGALGVGGLVGLVALRQPGSVPEPRDIGVPVLLLAGAWVAGLAARSIRAGRGDPRVTGHRDDEGADGALVDAAGRERIARDLRDVIERSMSMVILQARAARGSLDGDPERSRRALDIIEATGSDALSEGQRLVGALLSPDGLPLSGPLPGLADVDYLAERMTDAGLPVDVRIEGRAYELSPYVDAIAYQVVQESLLNALEHAGPARASVVLRYDVDELGIEVVDDGGGVEGSSAQGELSTLAGLRRSLAELGGSLDAGPGSRGGYWVVARIPLEAE